jgi:hypothetical protein
MSIARMQTMHGLQISDDDRRTLVKYLADTQGLAPSETDGVRYALERRLNTVEHFDDQTSQMCGRCHSGARVALQRRPAQEWERLVNFHLGQWPSLEYQALVRHRPQGHGAAAGQTLSAGQPSVEKMAERGAQSRGAGGRLELQRALAGQG